MIPFTPGTRLGNFRIVGRLGSGGMGEVHRALDIRLRREVAIKVLPPHLLGDADALSRFEKEALALAQLSHPNILSIFDIGREQEVSFAVTELLEGETLRDRISRGSLGWSETVQIALGIAAGLAAAHRKGIVHRDLKPSNVFLTRDGQVKILDFGLARLAAAATSEDSPTASLRSDPLTSSGQMVGTVGYISPEQLLEQPVDERSDLFSFGCILWEMLSGRRAFSGKTIPSTLLAIVSEEPPPIEALAPGLPRPLIELVGGCLEKDPGRRLASADMAVQVLRSLEHSSPRLPSSAAPPTPPRHRLLIAGASAALLVALVVGSTWNRSQPGEEEIASQRSIAVLPLSSLDSEPGKDYFADGLTEDLIARLSRVAELRVISRGTTDHYRELQRTMSLPDIARELDVETLLQGSVRQSGRRVRIVSSLIDGESGETLWAESYDREIEDIFVVQTDVAEQIAAALETKLKPTEEDRMRSSPTENPEAFQLYMRGRYFWNHRSLEGFRAAIDYFERAIELDPGFALAYAGLADAYTLLPFYGADPDGSAYERARAAARTALELDSTLAEAHTTLAFIEHHYDWDHIRAENDFRRALLLNPSYATARHWYALLLHQMSRRREALREIREALALDPYSHAIQKNSAPILADNGHLDEAKARLNRALEAMPELRDAHHQLALVHLRAGEPEQAMVAIRREIELSGSDRGINSGLQAVVAARLGDDPSARSILSDLEQRHRDDPAAAISPYWIGVVHVALGQPAEAMRWLEIAYRTRDRFLLALASDRHLVDIARLPGGERLASRVYGEAWPIIRSAYDAR